MKIESKIKILGWILIAWGCAGLFGKVILPVLFVPLGIGILLKNKTCAIIAKYIFFLGICMSILGVLSFLASLIPRLYGGGNTAGRNANLLLVFILVMVVVLGFVFWYMYRFLKRQDVITEFTKNKMR